jgi:endonuclease/exonuclease/phosphatase (EEP) superfamily protein YafD
VLKYHQRSDAEIIVLLEINDAWVENLSPLINSHPHRIILPREDNFGIALYSSFPITARTTDTLPPGIPVLSATIATHQGPVHIIAAHPIPPMGAAYQRARNAYLNQVAGMASQQDGPTIVLGDFNSSPWSPVFRDLVKSTRLRDSGRHRGFQSTWNRRHPLKSIPIDHVLHTPDLQVFDRHIGPGLGSDHHPVHVTFSFGDR